jgi:hypothetical protein
MWLDEYTPATQRLFWRIQYWMLGGLAAGATIAIIAFALRNPDRTPWFLYAAWPLVVVMGVCAVGGVRAATRFRRAGYAERRALGR